METNDEDQWEEAACNINDHWVPESDEEGDIIDEQVQYFDLNDLAEDTREHIVFSFDLNEPASNEPTEYFQQQSYGPQGHQRKKKPRLSWDTRLQILMWLLNNHIKGEKGKPYFGAMAHVARIYNCHPRTVSRIWKTARAQKEAFQRYNMATKAKNAGRKRIQVEQDSITELSMGDRTCIRDLAEMLNIGPTTLWRMIKRGDVRPHTNPLHPGLQDPNMLQRVKWVLDLLEGDSPQTKRQYLPMFDFVHIDEKWFYLTKKQQRVYLGKNERGKYRSDKSSKFIPKVMFTAAVARPRFNENDECTFDGKLGIFPFTYQEAAKRTSKNREKGTMKTKVVESVKKEETRNMLINQIVPAIMQKWPPSEGPKTIFIQQDNAKTHITHSDPQWQQAHQQGDFTFILVQQPPNNPDLNILDLGLFRSIQSLMHKKMPKDVDAMIGAVNQAYYELEARTLGNVWLSYQYVMNEMLKAKGSNDYDLPHVKKARLFSQGILPIQVIVPMWAVHEGWELLYGTENEAARQPRANTQTEAARANAQVRPQIPNAQTQAARANAQVRPQIPNAQTQAARANAQQNRARQPIKDIPESSNAQQNRTRQAMEEWEEWEDIQDPTRPSRGLRILG
ncbi:uncharacterized protein [Spinacia oleracea]|uniref:Uncharacterized protein n=1 Tax=Spinacia oleracea TaxID=3562 RepID=A0ABM3R238_SPIOL|nr:uncharacterized protein LOC110787090 [Spinacia oleracea]